VHKELMFFVIKMTALRWNFPHACIKLKAVGKAGMGGFRKVGGKSEYAWLQSFRRTLYGIHYQYWSTPAAGAKNRSSAKLQRELKTFRDLIVFRL